MWKHSCAGSDEDMRLNEFCLKKETKDQKVLGHVIKAVYFSFKNCI